MSYDSILEGIENVIRLDRFSGRILKEKIMPELESLNPELSVIKNRIDTRQYDHIVISLIRNVFLIELVNDEISSTKMETRWGEKPSVGKKQEEFNSSDPRFASFNDCKKIFEKLVSDLEKNLDDKKIEVLYNYENYNLIPYEIPVDYIAKNNTRIHSSDNIEWFWDVTSQSVVKLRSKLLGKENDHSELFSKMLKDKIKVKTYLTDRVQTGTHKTNREKRWEVHPDSVHFSLRKDCLLIEKELISQVLNFEKCPKEIIESTNGLIKKTKTYCCPVTLEPLNFSNFEAEVLRPTHGISKFQVGHLNPLKSTSLDGKNTHSYRNIGWISDDGNRIQGSMSIEEVRKLLKKISQNYENQK